jgi:hypothetical protein
MDFESKIKHRKTTTLPATILLLKIGVDYNGKYKWPRDKDKVINIESPLERQFNIIPTTTDDQFKEAVMTIHRLRLGNYQIEFADDVLESEYGSSFRNMSFDNVPSEYYIYFDKEFFGSDLPKNFKEITDEGVILDFLKTKFGLTLEPNEDKVKNHKRPNFYSGSLDFYSDIEEEPLFGEEPLEEEPLEEPLEEEQ